MDLQLNRELLLMGAYLQGRPVPKNLSFEKKVSSGYAGTWQENGDLADRQKRLCKVLNITYKPNSTMVDLIEQHALEEAADRNLEQVVRRVEIASRLPSQFDSVLRDICKERGIL